MYFVFSCPYVTHFPTVTAQYSLFVLKVPLNPKQTNNACSTPLAVHSVAAVHITQRSCVGFPIPSLDQWKWKWRTWIGFRPHLPAPSLFALAPFYLLNTVRDSDWDWCSISQQYLWLSSQTNSIVALLCLRPPRAEALSDAFVWRLSVCHVYRAPPNSRTERPRKTKIGTEVAYVTRDSDFGHHFQGQRSTCCWCLK